MGKSGITVMDLGLLGYGEALSFQRRAVADRKAGRAGDRLILVEHPPVVTLGRLADEANIRLPREALLARGVEVYDVERGGDVTYHGPGQLVGYPIIDLKRAGLGVHEYLRLLEETIIETAAGFAIEAFTRKGLTGVWTCQGKLAAIGVAVSRWISYHGFALNVETDLAGFDSIVPCGLAGERVTSMRRILGRPVDMAAVKRAVADILARRLDAVIDQSGESIDG